MDRLPTPAKKAFTVLELMVVLVVCSVIMFLAFRGYRAVQGVAAKAQCIQNLRHLYVSTLGFVEDYSGMLPPSLGPETGVHPAFNYNQYWWEQAYLGRYATNKPSRRRDSAGAITEEEAAIYRCPARFRDGPDSFWAQSGSNKPGITYLMIKLSATPDNYNLRTMQNRSRRLYITEGRASTLAALYAKTGELGTKSGNRLRRYHNTGMNILFFDGHVEFFSGADEDLLPLLETTNDD